MRKQNGALRGLEKEEEGGRRKAIGCRLRVCCVQSRRRSCKSGMLGTTWSGQSLFACSLSDSRFFFLLFLFLLLAANGVKHLVIRYFLSSSSSKLQSGVPSSPTHHSVKSPTGCLHLHNYKPSTPPLFPFFSHYYFNCPKREL